jgi:hypothetical protein
MEKRISDLTPPLVEQDLTRTSTTSVPSVAAVKNNTVLLAGDQTVNGVKTFATGIKAASYNSTNSQVSLGFANRVGLNGIELKTSYPLCDLGFAVNNGKSTLLRFEGRSGFGGDNDQLHCNRIDDEKGAFQFMDISQSPYTQGATYLSVSPKLFLVRLGVKVGIANDNPQEMLDVTGNVKAVKFIGDGSLLTNLPTGAGGASVTIEQDITSNSTTSVPSVSAVKSAINAANNHAADIVNTSKSRKFYTDVKDAVVESVAGDTINLYTPLAIVPTQDIEAYFYLKGDVNLNLYGVKIVSPDTRQHFDTACHW